MVTLMEITKENWFQSTQLKVTEEQRKLFTAPVVYWLAESKYETHFNPLAIYLKDIMVGFAIYIVNESGVGEIEAIMIDQNHQGRGYGRSAMMALINLLKYEYHCKEVRLSHRRKNVIASKLYESLGFEVINSENAILRRLIL